MFVSMVLSLLVFFFVFFFFQAEDGIRDIGVTGVQTCALPIYYSELSVTSPRPCSGQSSVPSELRSRGGRPFLPARQLGRNLGPRETLSMIGVDRRGLKDPQLSSSHLSGQA